MNIKKLLLIAILGLSTATVRPMDMCPADEFIGTAVATIVPSGLIGFGVGTAISSMAGTLFDAVMNQKMIDAVASCLEITNKNHVVIAVNIARLAAQIGSKYYWGRPLRHKFMDWLITTMKAKGIAFDAELAKTTARTFDWLATAGQINTDYSLALQKTALNQLNNPRIVIHN